MAEELNAKEAGKLTALAKKQAYEARRDADRKQNDAWEKEATELIETAKANLYHIIGRAADAGEHELRYRVPNGNHVLGHQLAVLLRNKGYHVDTLGFNVAGEPALRIWWYAEE